MPLTVSHALSATTPDDPTYEIRPSHWNSAHAFTLNASGSEISGAFSNAGNVTFGLETNGFITASANAAGAGDGFNRIAAGTQTAGTNNTIVFANSNGVTFGMSGSTQITASHNGITQQSTQPVAFNAGAVSSNFSTLVFQDSNGVSWSNNAGSIRASVRTDYLTTARASNDAVGLNTALTAGPLAWTVNSAGLSLNAGSAAGTTSGFAGNLISGSMTHNTAGLNLSLDHPAWLTTAAQSNHSHGNPTLALTNLSGTTASNSNGLTLSLSAAAPGGGGNFSAGVSNLGNTGGDTGVSGTRLVLVGSQNITLNQATDANGLTVSFSGGAGAAGNTGFISAGANTASLGTVVFSNSNGVSFGVNGQTVTASHNGITSQTAQTIGVYATSNTTQNSSGTFDARSLTIRGYGVLSVGTSNGSLLLSTPDPVDFTQLSVGISGGNTAGDTGVVTGRMVLAGGANITLSGSTNGGSATVSIVGGAGGGGAAISAGANSQSTGTVNFANSNGITFGLSNNGTLTASHNGLTSQSNQALSGSNGSFTFQTATFGNLNGLSFYSSNGSMVGSYTVPTQSAQTLGLYASSQTTAQSSSSTVDARSLTIVGQGNISVGLSGGSFIISQTGGGGVNPAASASNGSFAFTTLNFSNANNVTFGTSAGGIITASVAAPGAAAENNWVNLLGANTAGNTTASGSTIGYSGINITLSGTNGSVVNISAPATSSLVGVSGISLSSNGSTVSILPAANSYYAFPDLVINSQTWSAHGSTSRVFPMELHGMHHFNHLRMLQSVSLSSMGAIATTANTTFSMRHDISHTVVIYSRGVGASSQSLQYVTSTSASQRADVSIAANANGSQWTASHWYSFPGSSTAQDSFSSSYATSSASFNVSTTHLTRMTGMKFFPMPWNVTLPEGDYWIAYGASSALSTNGNASISRFSLATSNWGLSQINTTMGEFGAVSASSVQMQYGVGSFTTNAVGSTASIPLANVSSAASHLIPYITFARIA